MARRYEVQVRLSFGWSSAGAWPARTRAEGIQSLDRAADGHHAYRLVSLTPIVIARRPKLRRKESR